ncbi:hypothetical protein SISNIDRAFT_487268 [Sistotremastrum niveocremeum HHB9708]|uniref:Uncharacterized protein n=1 Tax=Sistotremastrum niveocremeum HHB9708 TaxID=1314777 RepID=A0A164SLH6_9AGAM|nr:hypothetical protein SISNIDRAFT_487268 [Sistotremastrum niveocremeum HHB9708]
MPSFRSRRGTGYFKNKNPNSNTPQNYQYYISLWATSEGHKFDWHSVVQTGGRPAHIPVWQAIPKITWSDGTVEILYHYTECAAEQKLAKEAAAKAMAESGHCTYSWKLIGFIEAHQKQSIHPLNRNFLHLASPL